MRVVRKAQNTRLKRMVALKFSPSQVCENPEEKACLDHEAQPASALNHPRVTTTHEIHDPRRE